MYAGLDEKPWNNFLDKLLNRENLNFRREIEGAGGMVVPDWNHCLEYEFHQRTRRLCPAGVMGCSRRPTTPHGALGHVSDSRQLAQSVLSGFDGEVALLRKEVVPLRSQRSRSPRGQRAQKQALALKVKPSQKGKGG